MHHIHLSHLIWKDFLKPGMTVIDATCGNGHDALYLAKLTLHPKKGRLFAIDIQQSALHKTRLLLEKSLPPSLMKRIVLLEASHETFPEEIQQANLIVYNFGYLPNGDPLLTTMTPSSLKSCQAATSLLPKGGMLSLTLYPGHEEGKREASALLEWALSLPQKQFLTTHHFPLSSPNSPSLLIIRKISLE